MKNANDPEQMLPELNKKLITMIALRLNFTTNTLRVSDSSLLTLSYYHVA